MLPALLYSAIGTIIYFIEIVLFFGPDKLALTPVGLYGLILLLIPAVALCGASVASIISSRVTTYQAAQSYSSLILVVLWFGLAGLLLLGSLRGLWVFAFAVAVVYVIDVLLITISAATWKREEVMAKQ